MSYFVGIDWAKEEHAVCVLDDAGPKPVPTHFVVQHSADGLDDLIERLARFGAAADLPVAIERPNGLLVDTLVAAGHTVVPVHPNVLKACRPRYTAAGGKSDRRDAYILADVLRTDGHRLRELVPNGDAFRALQATVRTRDDLVRQRVMATNQLGALLEVFWPGAVGLFDKLESQIALAFLKKYPTPAAARRLGVKRMEAFLKGNGYSGKQSAEALIAKLREAPKGCAGQLEVEARGVLVLAQVALIEALVPQIKSLDKHITKAVAQIPAGRIIMSFPRTGSINAAQILAEIGDHVLAYDSAEGLAADAGVVPSPYESGKKAQEKRQHPRPGLAFFRYACNKRLRRALTCWADNSRRASPWAQDRYLAARARGKSHNNAVRILARSWVRVLWRCLVANTAYDPDRHGGAVTFADQLKAA